MMILKNRGGGKWFWKTEGGTHDDFKTRKEAWWFGKQGKGHDLRLKINSTETW